MSLKFPHLFEPITLGRTTFRNRIFSSPQDYLNLSAENFLTRDAIAFYELKALGGFASQRAETVAVDFPPELDRTLRKKSVTTPAITCMPASSTVIGSR